MTDLSGGRRRRQAPRIVARCNSAAVPRRASLASAGAAALVCGAGRRVRAARAASPETRGAPRMSVRLVVCTGRRAADRCMWPRPASWPPSRSGSAARSEPERPRATREAASPEPSRRAGRRLDSGSAAPSEPGRLRATRLRAASPETLRAAFARDTRRSAYVGAPRGLSGAWYVRQIGACGRGPASWPPSRSGSAARSEPREAARDAAEGRVARDAEAPRGCRVRLVPCTAVLRAYTVPRSRGFAWQPTMLMQSIARLVLVLACLTPALSFAQPLLPAAPETVGLAPTRLARLTDTIRRYVDEGRIAGTVTLVLRQGRVAYFEAAGRADIEKNVPMQTDTHLPHRVDERRRSRASRS